MHAAVIDRVEHRKEAAERHTVNLTLSRARTQSVIETDPDHFSSKIDLYASNAVVLPSCGACSASPVHHLQYASPKNAKDVQSSSAYARLSIKPPHGEPHDPKVSDNQRVSPTHIESSLRISNSDIAIKDECVKLDLYEDEGVNKNGTPYEEIEANHLSEKGATAGSFGTFLEASLPCND